MTGDQSSRSVNEIRRHFTARLNDALLRPGLYGGELIVSQFLADLAWIDGRESQAGAVVKSFTAIGAWSPIGVRGVFVDMFGGRPEDHEQATAFVYADLARIWGYLEPQRILSSEEY
jgi:hypothetical protein